MKLETSYLGMNLKNPLVASSSPMMSDVDKVKKIEDAGASAVVMYSLFEEQIARENQAMDQIFQTSSDSYAEALSYFPEPEEFHNLYAEDYLEQVRKLKESLDIPVIGSLNGTTEGGWMSYAQKIEEAGADALELNIYYIAADPTQSSAEVEQKYIDDLKAVKKHVSIPVAVKLSPYFSSFGNMAVRLEQAGANGLVLFNRFYQPDIDLENLEVEPSIELSTSFEKRLPLRWIAMLRPHIDGSLAATTGVHGGSDVLKMMLSGADVAMMTSAILREGPGVLRRMQNEIEVWMENKEYESISEMKGAMSSASVADPAAFERANYLKALQGFKLEDL